MILPGVRDPRLVTIRRGGGLTEADHQLLALWAASCAEHVLHFFEDEAPADFRPRPFSISSSVRTTPKSGAALILRYREGPGR